MSRIGFICLFLLILSGCNLGSAPEATLEPPTPETIALTCDEMVTEALAKAGTICESTGRNQACYGNNLVQAELESGTNATFNVAGDIADLFAIKSLTTSPLNLESRTWGVAILKVQANLPDTLPGQNVTFLLYGDAALENITPQMQAVVLKTGLTETTCSDAPKSALLLQSPAGTQATLTINGASITLGSTVYITSEQFKEIEIATIEGSAVVSAFNTTRIVQPGAKVGLLLGGSDGLEVAGPPSEPEPFDAQVIQNAPLPLLERQIIVPPPITESTNTTSTPVLPTRTAAPANPTCTPRADWTFTYTVQRGDTLFSIAQRVGLTLNQLQEGNCITNPNLLQAGQILRIPIQLVSTSAPPNTPVPTNTAVPTGPNLRADNVIINTGECTTIRWDVANVSQVYFEGQPTTGNSSQQVCPTIDTTYTLLVVYPDGKQAPFTIRVQVALPPETTPELQR
ncbi:MAG: LysM peptidoglycan-binding domain-containing protein [Anaerolineae bacterium]|nr:LysM peptidoglycan-binding domain-containing protein [Anaerolineae bacterium]